jgi:hypothetical protein
MHLTRWDRPHTIRDMSEPDIGTLSVRFSVEERRLLEDFASISGVSVESLIREALFLPPLDARTRRHLRIVRGTGPECDQTASAMSAAAPAWPVAATRASARRAVRPAAAQRD